ncbi:MAG: metallophosphoesterase [Clostridiales bacterium]|nr:metallophosphoesterase [Clostridiales bacterium]
MMPALKKEPLIVTKYSFPFPAGFCPGTPYSRCPEVSSGSYPKTSRGLHSEVSRSLRLALIADLHEGDPRAALRLLKRERPDVILVAGDLLERHEEGASEWTNERMDEWMSRGNRNCHPAIRAARNAAIRLLNGLSREKDSHARNAYAFLKNARALAPVYYSVGNHEWYFTDEDRALFVRIGITLLDNADTVWESPAGPILIGGLSTRYDLDWLDRFSRRPGYKLLLCHHPEYYFRYIQGTVRDAFDLIFSGHAHGGQWRIGGRGVFAPGQGFFSKYVYGDFPTAKGRLIVSSGASNTVSIPRLGNPCELVMIELHETA